MRAFFSRNLVYMQSVVNALQKILFRENHLTEKDKSMQCLVETEKRQVDVCTRMFKKCSNQIRQAICLNKNENEKTKKSGPKEVYIMQDIAKKWRNRIIQSLILW